MPLPSASQAPPMRGRPRDPGLEDRVYDAAVGLYAEGGWAAMTFEAVARASGVGKSSLYRRWDDRAALLKNALAARWLPVNTIDTGTLRGDLRALAQMLFDNRTGPLAHLEQWFLVDASRYPDVRRVSRPYVQETVLEARAIVSRAVARGEAPRSLDAGLLMDLVVGAVNNHVTTTPTRPPRGDAAQGAGIPGSRRRRRARRARRRVRGALARRGAALCYRSECPQVGLDGRTPRECEGRCDDRRRRGVEPLGEPRLRSGCAACPLCGRARQAPARRWRRPVSRRELEGSLPNERDREERR